MQHINLITRRGFMERSMKVGLGVALSTLVDIPFVVKKALAEGNIGLNGKKLLFIFLRGANDAVNTVIPVKDNAYTDINPDTGKVIRPDIGIPLEAPSYYDTAGDCDYPTDPLFGYTKAIRLGNGFAALHPALKYLAPVYNAGDLALIHRVGYPRQSRSHFDSQNYWETGLPNNNLAKDGILYRTMLQSGLASTAALTGVSVQSALPLILRGSGAAMTNLTDPTRYDLLGIPQTTAGNLKADNFLRLGNSMPAVDKKSREMLELQYKNLSDTLSIFASIDFGEDPSGGKPGNYYTDADTGFNLFPTTDAKNQGQIEKSEQSSFKNLKAAAIILNKTDAIVAGTEYGNFDHHDTQGSSGGKHARYLKSVGWAIYALRKYFQQYSDKVSWNNMIVVTLSEFGRTTVQNTSFGTDHAEAGVMFVAGGAVQGRSKNGVTSAAFGCSPNDPASILWKPGFRTTSLTTCGTMFAAGLNVQAGYMRRGYDYRSVLGKIIRDHLGATQNQLDKIIPGYADTTKEFLGGAGGTSLIDGTPIGGEPPII